MSQTSKQCTGCKEVKPLTEFYKRKSNKDGLHGYCKTCCKASVRDYRLRNADEVTRKHTEYNRRNKDKKAKWQRRYYEKNKDKVKAYRKGYNAENKAKSCMYANTRRAQKLNATPPWLTNAMHKQIERKYEEAQRLSRTTGIPHEVDHIDPLISEFVCGLHVPWNLRVITKRENRSKHNKVLEVAA